MIIHGFFRPAGGGAIINHGFFRPAGGSVRAGSGGFATTQKIHTFVLLIYFQ
jgi:hypothetical protein